MVDKRVFERFLIISILRNDFRLQYFNLKMSRSQNALSLSEMQKLWIPFLVFENTQKNEATVATGDTELTVLRFVINFDIFNLYREGKFIGSKDDNVEEINIFEGTENRIIFEQVQSVLVLDNKNTHYISGVHKNLQMHLPATALSL